VQVIGERDSRDWFALIPYLVSANSATIFSHGVWSSYQNTKFGGYVAFFTADTLDALKPIAKTRGASEKPLSAESPEI
jgi:hypothetical protein